MPRGAGGHLAGIISREDGMAFIVKRQNDTFMHFSNTVRYLCICDCSRLISLTTLLKFGIK